jgi:hypothetical protein
MEKWFLITGLEPWNFMTFHSVGNVIIPPEGLKAPSRFINQILHIVIRKLLKNPMKNPMDFPHGFPLWK